MSYIAPDSDIYIIKDCPLLPSYEHTYFFEDSESQFTYFSQRAAYHLTEQSYQRAHMGRMRVQILADNIYNANYLMFRNTAFGNKWFYAFITNVTYINNVTSEITYKIDVLQTWHFDYTLRMCLVEREHTATDLIGEYILPEGLEVGEYVSNSEGQILNTTKWYTVAVISDTEDDGTWYHDGLLQGVVLKAFDSSLGYDELFSLIQSYIQEPESIVSMYVVPGEVIDNSGITLESDGTLGSNSVYTFTFSASAVSSDDSLDGYVPKNKKLYTYPYNFYRIITPSGDSLVTRYEFCEDLAPQYEISMPLTQPINVICRPINYKGCTLGNTGESITLSNYPMIAWSYDAYEAYIAQNAVPSAIGYASKLASIGLSVAGGVVGGNSMGEGISSQLSTQTSDSTANLGNSVRSLVDYTASRLMKNYQASIAADPVRGSTTSGNVDIGAGHQTFYTNRMSVSSEIAEQIDNYFTVFGYQVNTLKQPNRAARPYYTYVKTMNCTITGLVPADDKAAIESIYNKGITWWKTSATIGDYSVDNTV